MRLRGLALGLALAACGDDGRVVYDSRPFVVARAPLLGGSAAPGAVLAAAAGGGATILVDTATPVSTLPRAPCDPAVPPRSRGLVDGNLLLGDADPARPPGALRAGYLRVPLADQCGFPVGAEVTRPGAVLGGDLLRANVVRFQLPLVGASTMSLWDDLPATDESLALTGFAVVSFSLSGGGTVYTGPSKYALPATRVVLRGCGAAAAFDPDAATNQLCPNGALAASATGVNLSLLLGTGVGPLVLKASAWRRVASAAGLDPTAGTRAPLYWGRAPVEALWVTVPRLAIVNQQMDEDDSPGACAELGRARRIEWALRHREGGGCYQPCDAGGDRVETSAAYFELGGGIVTAVVPDDEESIAGASVEIGAAAPQLDGIVGAGVLSGMRFDVDYRNGADARLAAACLQGVMRERCWSAPSCVRLTNDVEKQLCFGLPAAPRVPVCGFE